MNRFFRLCSGLLFLSLQQPVAAQEFFQVSGGVRQPEICIRYAGSDTIVPRLFLLYGKDTADIAVGGRYEHHGERICFRPLYPLANGARFLLRAKGCKDSLLVVPEENRIVPADNAEVSHFYPVSDTIPENILFFHVRFTQPMKEDMDAWKKVRIYDDRSRLISGTWRQRSFWLDSGRLLVLMIHPGRVKNGIHYTGPVFYKGHHYTVLVDSTMQDKYGRNIKIAEHSYYVSGEQREILNTCGYDKKVRSGTHDPLHIRFCSGIDHAAAISGIRVYDEQGHTLNCEIEQLYDTLIRFRPSKPWPVGTLRIELAGDLYDAAGNRLNRLFEMKDKQTIFKDELAQVLNVIAE